ncbi:MAG: hypothetical protein FH748_15445 [Balneolaceae bacterium]|nr:hypothetical protein [Balneolaceae bacterium]
MENKRRMMYISGMIALIAILLTPLACDSVNSVDKTSDRLSLEEVMLAHRAAMEQAKNDFNVDPELSESDIEAKINYFSKFNQSSIRNMNLDEGKILALNSAIDNYKDMAVRFEYSSLNKQKIATNDPIEIQQVVIDDLESTGLFSQSEIKLMRRIASSFELAESGQVPPFSLADSIATYKESYQQISGNSEDSYYTVGVILAVAEESYDWWLKNPDAIGTTEGKSKTALLPNVVAQDAAGAIVGAGIAAGYQLTTDDFDWGAVGWAAAGGAIVASTGVVGKIAKWLS